MKVSKRCPQCGRGKPVVQHLEKEKVYVCTKCCIEWLMGFPLDYTEVPVVNKMGGKKARAKSGTKTEGPEVSGLRGSQGSTATPPGLQGPRSLRDTVPDLSHSSGPEGRNETEEGQKAVQGMREAISTDSQQEPHDLQPRVFIRDRAPEREETMGPWESEWPGIPRVIHERRADRIPRLKALGNACLPQITEWIGRRIVEDYNLGA